MLSTILIITGSILTILWGLTHIFPTGSVIRGFGDISRDNQRIIRMEWLNESLTLFFIGILNTVTTLVNTSMHLQNSIHLLSAVMLFAMAILSLFTGARINFLPFRLCPVIFSVSAVLLILGVFL
ncbi:MAG: hypothetical protein JSW02_09410 [candidate division WOR-3 bacterium]|nr:MAG: hypothetical protein JSW02_09410 [candidate division WOR-3 bacterium]